MSICDECGENNLCTNCLYYYESHSEFTSTDIREIEHTYTEILPVVHDISKFDFIAVA